jgi:hypothetical protein
MQPIRKTQIFGKMEKTALENFFQKIKIGHFKNVQFQKKTINNRPLLFLWV